MRGLMRSRLLATCLVLNACTATVRGGLSEQEANQLVVALDSAAIAATKLAETTGGQQRFLVEVASVDMTRALKVLQAEKLPKAIEPGFEALYRETGLVATPIEERARWAAATTGELSRSLERLHGVLDARVHLALPETPQQLDAERPQPRAAVLIQRQRQVPPIDEAKVRALVAGAVDGLAVERVTVVQVVAEPQPRAALALVHVGPIAVTGGSAFALRALLGGALALDLVLAAALVALVRRKRGVPDDGA
jgi:type III secretion protein J